MQRTGREDNLPSSPWAERFPLGRYSFVSENTNHSALVPFPRIDDPRYYDQKPNYQEERIPTQNEELDKIFWSEMVQAYAMHGRETWQAAVLSRYLQFTPNTGFVSGGHGLISTRVSDLSISISGILPPPPPVHFVGLQTRLAAIKTNEERDFQIYLRERIEVHENHWLRFLQKGRWYDWIQFTPPFENAGRTWSVDDPRIWDVLKVVLELVNRILTTLIKDKHEGGKYISSSFVSHNDCANFLVLQTMLYGRLCYWSDLAHIFGQPPSPNAILHLSYAAETMICQKTGVLLNPFHSVLEQTPEQWEARLSKLLRKLTWTFNDIFPADAQNTRIPCVGNNTYPFPSINCIGIRTLETILDSKLTLAELCSLQVELAVVTVHELMHAIIAARYMDDEYIGNQLNPERTGAELIEPFLDGQGIAETGHYMDQLFWGGVINSDPGGAAKRGAPPLGLCFTEWPWFGYQQQPAVPESAFMELGAIVTNHHVPLTWASKMLSESFWADPAYPKKSANYFHRNVLFVSKSKNNGHALPTFNPPQVQDLDSLPNEYPGDMIVIEDWNERQRLLDQFHASWYGDAKKEWSMSPWSNMHERQSYYEFEVAFAKKDIVECVRAADKLVAAMQWMQGANSLLYDLPSKPRKRGHRMWAWHIMGLLMMASVPIQLTQIGRIANLNGYMTEHAPSISAAKSGRQLTVYIPKSPQYQNEVRIGPSRCFNIRAQRSNIDTITQFDYIQRVDDIIALIMANRLPVHEGFLTAIINAKAEILAERQALAASYPGRAHIARWCMNWSFRLPAYNPAYVTFNPDDLTWQPISSQELDNPVGNPGS